MFYSPNTRDFHVYNVIFEMSSIYQASSSLGLLVGVIVGAGMFALPYAVMRAGFLWGAVHLLLTFFIVTSIHVLYSFVITATPGKHRLPGYARMYLGAWAGWLAFLSAFGGFYGALLVYGILGGMFLSRLFPGTALGTEGFTFAFFAAGAAVLLMNLRRVGEVNFFLTLVLILFVLFLAIMSLPYVQVSHIISIPESADWFLPYGVFLFAFAGASALPDAAEVFRRETKNRNGLFRRVVVLSTVIPLFLYVIFIGSVVGVSGAETSPEAIWGLEKMVGQKAVVAGSLIGFLAVFTSFLGLGLDLKNIFRYDIGWHSSVAWVLVVSIPVFLFAAGVNDFVRVIGLVGAGALGIDGIIILLSALRVCRGGERCTVGGISFHPAFPMVLIVALSAGVFYELLIITGIL